MRERTDRSLTGFGGVKDSGTGWREAGIEALDVYSEQKVVNLVVDQRSMNTTAAVLGPGAVGGSLAVRLCNAGVPVICVAHPEAVGLIALAGSSSSRPKGRRRLAWRWWSSSRSRSVSCS